VTEKVEIRISKELYERAERFIRENGGFNSVEELVEFLLQEVLETEAEGTGLSKEEEEKVKERLRSLGYI
jgi:Arc/MetJ-type ribon-helix-helix transcriptional regulator